ncbi:MAG: 6-carboxytetrahydropterin synthase [Saprospiraceae bacterium]|nr:6-carboxytetrahydropterin synthase [Saprospiraceae bacterium]
MVYLTRKEHFNAAHKLYNPNWTEEKNLAVFGKCANHNFHGHNYELYVTVKGQPHPDTGYIMDAKHLGNLMNKYICDELDHKNLNTQVPFLSNLMPTTENVAKAIFHRLKPHITEAELHCVKLVETEKIFVEYYGE